MAYSKVVIPGDGVTTLVAVDFALSYIAKEHVTCRVGNEADGTGEPVYRAFDFVQPGWAQVQGTPAQVGEDYVFTRTVPKTELIVDWEDGNPLTKENLNKAQKQSLHYCHELDDRLSGAEGTITKQAALFPSSYTGDTVLPVAEPNRFLAWAVNGLSIVNKTIASIGNLVSGTFGELLLSTSNLTEARYLLGVTRVPLLTDRQYFVRVDGNDSNTGLGDTPSAAFRTISKAKEVVYNTLDLNGFVAYINISPGEYDEQVYCSGRVVGHNNNNVDIIFRGTGASRNDVIVRRGFTAVGGARIRVTGMQLDPAGAAYTCLYCFDNGSAITASNITFGQAGPAGLSSNDHMYASDGGYIRMGAPYSIVGGALNHLHATEYAMIRVDGQTVAVTGNPSFDGQFAGVASSTLFIIGVTYSGSATGRTYLVHYNGVIRSNKNTRNVFPGTVVGVEQSGGRLDNAPMVRAGRSGSNLTLTNGSWQHVTPLNATVDIGGEFASSDAGARGRGGQVMIVGRVTFEAFNGPNELIGVSIYKNGVEFAAALDTSNDSTTSNQNRKTVSVMALDTVNVTNAGGDIYQLYARGGNTGTSIIHGSPSWTSLQLKQF